jgi:5-enolpyruvylshikimate-3-phosphate synthase
MLEFKINNTIINDINPTYFIAELSCNHNQDKSICFKLIDEAYKAGANAVKLQTYTPDTMTIDCENIPDAAMTLAVLALFAKGTTTLKSIASWRIKETDRIFAMKTELKKYGALVTSS